MRKALFGLLGAVSTLALTTTAGHSADLPRRVMAPAPMLAVPLFSWTGFYIGANAGYGFTNSDRDENPYGFGFGNQLFAPTAPVGALAPVTIPGYFPGFGAGFGDSGDQDGFVGGAQIGFNYQFTPGSGFVVGVEADLQYADLGNNRDALGNSFFGGGTNFYTAGTLPAGVGLGIAPPTGGLGNVALFNNGNSGFGFGRGGSSEIEYFGTVRARVGYAFDRVLVFATGGLAFADGGGNDNNGYGFGFGGFTPVPAPFFVSGPALIAGSAVVPNNFGFGGFSRNNDDMRYGYAVGGGIEYAVTNNLSIKIEGLYVNLDRDDNDGYVGGFSNVVGVTNTGAPITSFNNSFGASRKNEQDFTVVRAGINYRFSGF